MAEATTDDGLTRQLSLLDSIMINVGTMIGSGIFFVPATIALYVQSSLLTVGVWIAGGVVSLFGALSIAELSASMPRAGGQYVYLQKAYGPLWGFLYGWTAFVVINTASIAAIAVGFSTYLASFVPMDETGVRFAAVASVALLTGVNCVGLGVGVWTQNILTCIKIGALLALPLMAFFGASGSVQHMDPLLPADVSRGVLGPLALAMVAALWGYDGWIEVTYVAGEVKNPGRNLPLSIIVSTIIVILVYSLFSTACVWVLSVPAMSGSELVAKDLATTVVGPIGAGLVVVAILVATTGTNNGIVFTAARIPYAMAKEGIFFASLGRLSGRRHTPVFALVVQAILASAFVFTGSYDQLYTYVVFASWLFYAMSAAAVPLLRKKFPDLARPYRTWGYPFVPGLFVLFALLLMVYTVIEDPRSSLIGAGIVLTGIPAFIYWNRKRR